MASASRSRPTRRRTLIKRARLNPSSRRWEPTLLYAACSASGRVASATTSCSPRSLTVSRRGSERGVLCPGPVLGSRSVAVSSTVVIRRSEAIGADPVRGGRRTRRSDRHGIAAYVWASAYWARRRAGWLESINFNPTAFEGHAYLLPSVCRSYSVVTSLLGGKGNIVATALAALFLTQPIVRSRLWGSTRHPDSGAGGRARGRGRAVQRRLGLRARRMRPSAVLAAPV